MSVSGTPDDPASCWKSGQTKRLFWHETCTTCAVMLSGRRRCAARSRRSAASSSLLTLARNAVGVALAAVAACSEPVLDRAECRDCHDATRLGAVGRLWVSHGGS